MSKINTSFQVESWIIANLQTKNEKITLNEQLQFFVNCGI